MQPPLPCCSRRGPEASSPTRRQNFRWWPSQPLLLQTQWSLCGCWFHTTRCCSEVQVGRRDVPLPTAPRGGRATVSRSLGGSCNLRAESSYPTDTLQCGRKNAPFSLETEPLRPWGFKIFQEKPLSFFIYTLSRLPPLYRTQADWCWSRGPIYMTRDRTVLRTVPPQNDENLKNKKLS